MASRARRPIAVLALLLLAHGIAWGRGAPCSTAASDGLVAAAHSSGAPPRAPAAERTVHATHDADAPRHDAAADAGDHDRQPTPVHCADMASCAMAVVPSAGTIAYDVVARHDPVPAMDERAPARFSRSLDPPPPRA